MSDLPRYELIPSHDADVKSPSGASDEESGWPTNNGASTSTMVAPSRICYSFNPEYPVPGKAEDVVGIRGTSKEVSSTPISSDCRGTLNVIRTLASPFI